MNFVRVGDIAEQVRGVTYEKAEVRTEPGGGLVPVLRGGNIQDGRILMVDLVWIPSARISDRQKLRLGDVVVVASSGSIDVVGKAASVVEPLACSFGAFCKVLRPTSDVDARYFGHFFQTSDYRRRISGLAGGANINNLRSEHLDELAIPLPPIEEQRRIAAILDKSAEIRTKRRTALIQLDTLTQSLFLDLFGDPGGNPLDLEIGRLGDHVQVRGGFAFKSEHFAEGGAPIVRISNLDGLSLQLEDAVTVPGHLLGKGAEFEVYPRDILIAMSGATTGKLAQVPVDLSERIYQNQRVGMYRIPPQCRIGADFLWAFLNSPFHRQYVHATAAGAAQPNISGGQLEAVPIPLPPAPLLEEFSKRYSLVRSLTERCSSSLVGASEVFASLQTDLVRT